MKLHQQVDELRQFLKSTMLRVDALEQSNRRLKRAMSRVRDQVQTDIASEQAAEVRIAALEQGLKDANQGLKDANQALSDANAGLQAANATLQSVIDAKNADEEINLADLQTLQGHLDSINAAVTSVPSDTSAPAPDAGNAGSGDTSGSAPSSTSGDTSGASSDASGSSDGSAPVV